MAIARSADILNYMDNIRTLSTSLSQWRTERLLLTDRREMNSLTELARDTEACAGVLYIGYHLYPVPIYRHIQSSDW